MLQLPNDLFVFLKLNAIRLHSAVSVFNQQKFQACKLTTKNSTAESTSATYNSNLLDPLLIKTTRVLNLKAGFKRSCLRALTENIRRVNAIFMLTQPCFHQSFISLRTHAPLRFA